MSSQLIPLETIRKLASLVDPREKLDADVEMMIADMAADFVKDATAQACKLARHRGSDTIDMEDVMLPIDMKWKIRVPGFNQDLQPLAMKPGGKKQPTRAHAAITANVRAHVSSDTKKDKKRKGDADFGVGKRKK
ncbi:UNVERIFIED_CONTAM: hypothetical protein HDU68_000266 [Siphonaria sp. JEL0065]|nr:hypothetical protein HDU68_000266 [Siphonaria sp. JEL0065]